MEEGVSAVRFFDWGSSPIGRVLAVIADLVAVLTPIVALIVFLATGSSVVPATVLAIYVCLLCTFLLLGFVQQQSRYARAARYAPAMVPIHDAFGHLSAASWTIIENQSDDAFLAHLRDALRSLAEAFSLTADSTCRASIKMIAAEGDGVMDLLVYTLCRSNQGMEPQGAEVARIGNNSDFKSIFQGSTYFFSNDLVAMLGKGYRNSNWDEQVIRENRMEYRATIVWPIGRSTRGGIPHKQVIGFLCVDTLKTDAFNETYDVPLGMAFSEGLNLAIHRYRARVLGVDARGPDLQPNP